MANLGHVFKEDIWKQCLRLQQIITVISSLMLVQVLGLLILLSQRS